MNGNIQHQLFFTQSPEQVWEYLTDAGLISLWLMENNFMPIPGHEFQFRTRPLADYDFDGIVYCKVVEIVPFRKLSYSWKSGPGQGRITLDSLVVWTLEPGEGGTTLYLHHSGFLEGEDPGIFTLMDKGWLENIKKIAGYLHTAAKK